MIVNGRNYRTVWLEGRTVRMIDQKRLPHFFEIVDLPDHRDTARAIQDMTIRGAGAIGGAAGYAMAQVALEAPDGSDFMTYVVQGAETIRRTRPTAQNLFYAVNRVFTAIEGAENEAAARQAAVEEAQAVADEDAASCERIGQIGADLLRDGTRMMTHCNAGWLAFVDWGTALAPVYAAKRQGKREPMRIAARSATARFSWSCMLLMSHTVTMPIMRRRNLQPPWPATSRRMFRI